MNTFTLNNAVRVVGTPGGWTASAQYGTWINMLGFRTITFIAQNGELDGNMLLEPYQATDSTGTNAKVVGASYNGTFINGTDEGRAAIIEFRDVHLDSGYNFVTLRVTAGATDTYNSIAILSNPYDAPVDNGTADSIAFKRGEGA